jgi:predicted RNase H-like HicB family nuclease
MELEVIVHQDSETGGYWAQVVQLPGCYAAGHTREELTESLEEAIELYLKDWKGDDPVVSDHVAGIERYRLTADRKLLPV